MQGHRDRPARPRLLAYQAEVPDESRAGRVAQVVDLGHAPRPPSGVAAHQVGNARVRLPPALVRIGQPAHDSGHEPRLAGVGDLPHLVGGVAEAAEQVDHVGIAMREVFPAGDPHHLRTAALPRASRVHLFPGNVGEILGPAGIGDDGGPVGFGLAGQGLPSMVTDVRDPSGTVLARLLVDHRLVGGSSLEIVIPDQPHVPCLRPPLSVLIVVILVVVVAPGAEERRRGHQRPRARRRTRQQFAAGRFGFEKVPLCSHSLPPGALGRRRPPSSGPGCRNVNRPRLSYYSNRWKQSNKSIGLMTGILIGSLV